MKNNISVFCSALLISLSLSAIGHTAVQYGNYTNTNYNYKIIIPLSWNKEELTLSNKHFMYAVKDANTEIKVRAFRSSDQDIEKAVHSKTWDLRKIDPRLYKIIETEKIEIKKNVTGKLLIFEYKSNKNNLLQRTLIAQNNGIIYIIECKSPRNSFYKYDDIFTTALASFRYLQDGEIEKAPDSEIKKETKSDEEQKPDEDSEEELIEEDEQL